MELSLLLNDYVKRESDEEKIFINEQKQCNVKLHISVSHNNCHLINDSSDLLLIHAKITQIIEKNDDHFFIKSMKISHCTGIVQTKNNDNNKVMSIEIAITKDGSRYETIFKAFVNKDNNGIRNKFQMAYTRQIIKCIHPKGHDFENDQYHTVFSDSENDISEKSSNKDLSIFVPVHSTQMPIKETKRQKPSKISKDKDNSGVENNRFLGPLRKRRSTQLESFVPTVDVPKIIAPVLGTRKISLARIFSVEDAILERKKPTNILAKISVNKKKENYEFIEDDMAYMDEENDGDNVDVLTSETLTDFFIRFDFCIVKDVEEQKDKDVGGVECTCNERRMSAMSNYLLLSIQKQNSPDIKYNEIDKFDSKTQHYSDCCKTSPNNSSAFFPNSPNNVFNNLLTPEFELSKSVKSSLSGSVEHLDKCLEELKTTEDVICSLRHVDFFKNVKTYAKYKTTMRRILVNNASFENFIVFLYSIRVIIQQIDHPCNSTNEDINKIFEFSNRFIIEHFGPEVQRRGGLENFIIRRDDID